MKIVIDMDALRAVVESFSPKTDSALRAAIVQEAEDMRKRARERAVAGVAPGTEIEAPVYRYRA